MKYEMGEAIRKSKTAGFNQYYIQFWSGFRIMYEMHHHL
jgi:hypothetical protein